MAAFKPVQNCYSSLLPVHEGGPRRLVGADQISPWATGIPQPPIGVFERPPHQPWIMNDESGRPFPCPAPGGDTPHYGNGALPAQIVALWHMKYATNCAFVRNFSNSGVLRICPPRNGPTFSAAVSALLLGSLVGGWLGAMLIVRLPPLLVRVLVIAIGTATTIKLALG